MNSFTRLAAIAAVALSSATVQAQYAGPSSVQAMTIQDLLANGRDHQHVALQGRIVTHLGDDDYEFADTTGRIRVEIDKQLWVGHPAIDEKREVRLTGEFERKLPGRESVDVDRIEVMR